MTEILIQLPVAATVAYAFTVFFLVLCAVISVYVGLIAGMHFNGVGKETLAVFDVRKFEQETIGMSGRLEPYRSWTVYLVDEFVDTDFHVGTVEW